MEYCKMVTQPNPYDEANFISRNFFAWIIPLFNTGYRKDLEVNDLWKNPKVDASDRLGSRLQAEWDKEMKNCKKKPSLLRAIIRAFGFWYFMAGSLSILSEAILRVLQPIVMGLMIYFLEQYNATGDRTQLNYFFTSGVAVILIGILYIFAYHPYFFKMTRKGMQLRIACCNMIYRKALRLSHRALGQTTVGQMVNLLSNDVNRFDYAFIFVPFILTAPLQTVITIIYLYFFDFGWTVFVGCSVLLVYIPFQMYMGTLFSKLRASTAVLTDERIRLMNELISAMRVIKMYTWEKPFAKLVEWARLREVLVIKKTALLRGVNMALFFVSSKVIVFVTFVIFILTGHQFSPQHVFVAIALFNNFRTCLTLYFPYGISQGSEALISISRLEHFLLLEEKELQSEHINKRVEVEKRSKSGVWLEDVIASWSSNAEQEPTLNEISFSVTPGELLVIIGPVGSGKSSVLMSVLSEIPVYKGNLKVRGKVAYASQQAWTFAGSVRENVLFGSSFDEKKYKKVLHVCALEKDLELFPFGDKTIVGDRGVSLSGGQRARINLARALYCDADIYLLDDPLSAVDAAVSKHIFEKCIRGYLRDKTVLLVTHQLQFIKQAGKILVLEQGVPKAIGNYAELIKAGIDFVQATDEERQQQLQAEAEQKQEQTTSLRRTSHDSLSSSYLMHHRSSQVSQSSSFGGEELSNFITGETLQQTAGEKQTIGAVKARVFWVYVHAGAGFFLLTLLILSNITTQVLFNGSDYFLSLWTDKENDVKNILDPLTTHQCIYIFSGLVGALFVFSLVRTTTFFTICMKSSITLHNRLFECLIRAPITFFDANPIGVLLNRFSRDMGIIDDQVPPTSFDAVEIFVQLLGILILVALINYWIVIPTLVLIVMFYWIRKYYIASARSIKRLEGITRSPVFSHLANSLYGLSTVRAFGVQQTFEKKFDEYQDCHTAAWFLFISTARWFGIVLDWLCTLYLIAVTVALSLSYQTKTPSEIGLAISYAITLSGMFQWGVRQSAELESQMTSVERVDEYSHIEHEHNLESNADGRPKPPPPNWPSDGVIEFRDVSLTYVPDAPPVLKNLTFVIKSCEKVGIVGRTGAGKSSMISTLFRMMPPTGTILIDNLDTGSIALTDLRTKLSIIPQDPVIFAGPVRRNIDPFCQHTDSRLWQVLHEVQLKKVVLELAGGLDSVIAEGGSNLSVGQRQLFCLARAILKQNRILILDEATANVDHQTDLFIQDTIREKFAHCTVLTIAHRLHTIMDSDRVLVLDAGRVVEFDEPYKLLQNEQGLFSNMVKMTGKSMAHNLREMARLAHDLRHKSEVDVFDRAALRDLQGSFINTSRSGSMIKDTLFSETEEESTPSRSSSSRGSTSSAGSSTIKSGNVTPKEDVTVINNTGSINNTAKPKPGGGKHTEL